MTKPGTPDAVARTLQHAAALHGQGDTAGAEPLYRSVLGDQPRHPEAGHNLGVLLLQTGRNEEAVSLLRAALETDPSVGQYWVSYIEALIATGQPDAARSVLGEGERRGLSGPPVEILKARLAPAAGSAPAVDANQDANALAGAIIERFNEGRFDETEALCHQFTKRYPDTGFGWKALGTVMVQRGHSAEAIPYLERAAGLDPADPDIQNSLGKALQDAGRAEDALVHFREALKRHPDHAELHNNLANLLVKRDQGEEALQHYAVALRLKPDFAMARANMASVLLDMGRTAEAADRFREVLAAEPDNAMAHTQLADALAALGRTGEAMSHYERALAITPDNFGAHSNLADLFLKARRFDEAFEHYAKALAIEPENPLALNNLGVACEKRGAIQEALALYDRALASKPDFPEAHVNLGNALRAAGRLTESLAAFDKALALRPDFGEAHNNRGNTLCDGGCYEEAIASFQQALAIDPEHAATYNNLANALHTLGRLDEATANYERALALRPGHAGTHINIGVYFSRLGDNEKALRHYRFALEHEPDNAEIYYDMADMPSMPLAPADSDALRAILARPETTDDNRMYAHFTLGRLAHKAGDTDAAFTHFTAGHKLRNRRETRLGRAYDPDEDLGWLDVFRHTITPAFYAARTGWGNSSTEPVFVVGFPRSGTSLVEQILASHPAVHGAGELETIIRLGASIGLKRTPDNAPALMASLTPGQVEQLAGRYLGHIRALGRGMPHVVDKMPHNFQHLWLIALLFPRATILHCARTPEDTCLSCYFARFSNGHAYTDDLTSLGRHYRFYQAVMRHWQSALPVPIHTVRYEELVTEPEPAIRRLLECCGLAFDPACLDFHKTRRLVQTASASQVKKPIYTSSVQRWKRYEKHLAPLLAALHSPDATP